ncbi:hypothetical protein [Microbacterium sp. P5_E9]
MPDPLPATWPRLEVNPEHEIPALLQLTVDEAAERVDLSTDHLRFYPMAPRRVGSADLLQLRNGVLAIAERHGFPNARSRGARPSFDQELAAELVSLAPMLPVEAANQQVWAFITLRVLPDVALWRWPSRVETNALSWADEDDDFEFESEQPSSHVGRLLDRRRGLFRQAWWRGFLLGTQSVLLLDEDNFVQLTDRISLTGDSRLGASIVASHLHYLSNPTYDRRYGLRRALVLVGRLLGRLNVDALSDNEIHSAVVAQFENSVGVVNPNKKPIGSNSVAGEGSLRETSASAGTASSGGEVEDATMWPAFDSGVLYEVAGDGPQYDSVVPRFLALVGPYRPLVEPLLRPAEWQEAMAMARRAVNYARTLNNDQLAIEIAADLDKLAGEWMQMTTDEQAVATAAFEYFLLEDDEVSDLEPHGLLDDDDVVSAAFDALGRERGDGGTRFRRVR